jgi:hypothetical protein
VYSRIGERCLQDVKAVIDADGGHKVLIESCEMRWRDAYRATPPVSGVVLAKISLDTTAGRPIGHSAERYLLQHSAAAPGNILNMINSPTFKALASLFVFILFGMSRSIHTRRPEAFLS